VLGLDGQVVGISLRFIVFVVFLLGVTGYLAYRELIAAKRPAERGTTAKQGTTAKFR
jgi:hypothetical protein